MNMIRLSEERRAVLGIVAAYATFGSLWIYLSDSALGLVVSDPHIMTRIATYKGLLFILLTSLLLYFLISRYVRHISEKNRQLKISEDRFQSIYHGISDAVFIHDAVTGRILNVNRTACEMFGYQPEQFVTLDVADISLGVPPYSQTEAVEWLKYAACGEPQTFEWHCRRRDDSTFWTEVSMRAETIGEEQRIIVSVRDISWRKQSEEQLRLSEEKFATAFRASPDAVNLTRLSDGIYMDVNEGFTDITGYLPNEVIGRSALELNIWVNPQDRIRLVSELEEHGIVRNLEAEFRRKDGTTLIGHMSACTFDIGEESYILSITRDITERENRQKEFLKMQKLESLGVLAGGIAHDFNNILTGIMGNISFARMFLDESHRSFNILLEAEKASQRATDLAHQLLTFAKGGEPVKRVVSVRQLVQASASLTLRGSNILHLINIPDNLCNIEVDEGQINQAFNNIFINAAQAMPGGGTITVDAENVVMDETNVFSLQSGMYVRFTFTDTGCGISDETQKKIFDPYFTTKAGGNGLGLASVHSIITRHGGHIAVRSGLNQGTSFIILLPASMHSAPITDSKIQTSVTTMHGKGSLLVMDDEDMIRTMITAMLTELGYLVRTCADGDEAITLYKEAQDSGAPFSAVIMDLTIPGGMWGREAAGKILEIDPGARLIVSSGYSNDPIVADYRSFGFCASIVKPYTMLGLARLLQETIPAVNE